MILVPTSPNFCDSDSNDLDSDTWSEDIPVANNAEVRHMFGHTAILNGDIMYIFGGTNGTHVFDSFYQYNLGRTP